MSVSITKTNRLWLGFLAIFGFWTLIAVLEAIQIYIRFNPGPFGTFELAVDGRSISWGQWALANTFNWYILAIFTPVIFALSKRFPFDRKEKRWKTVLRHLGLSLVFGALFVAIEAVSTRLILGFGFNLLEFIDGFIQRLGLDFHLMVTAYWAILGAGFALEFYRRFRERESQAAKLELHSSKLETQLVTAQLDALKTQLHPHFLFNTLHTISALIDEKPDIARDMIADLSELLRFTLETVKEQKISLKKEIEITKLYLDIEKLRFEGKLQTDFQIEPKDLAAQVPSFILQPLVENAIKHGITSENKVTKIKIKALRVDDNLEITVEDNGRGFAEKNFEEVKKGIGLSNTKSRLEQLYGDTHEFNIENAENGGAVVRIILPFIEESKIDES